MFVKIHTIKACFVAGFFVVYCGPAFPQQTAEMDSLEWVYVQGRYKKEDRLILLHRLAKGSDDPQQILTYSEALIQAAGEVDSIRYLYGGYMEKGTALRLKSDLGNALQSYFQAAKLDITKHRLAKTYIAIADVYSIMGNHNNSVNYYQQAISILKKGKDSVDVATALYNLGDEYLKTGRLDSALAYTKQSQDLSKAISYAIGEAYCLGNMGKIYARSGDDRQAEKNLNKAIELLQGLDEFSAIAEYLLSMSDIYIEKKEINPAKSYAVKSYELAKKYGLKKEVSDASLKLSALYEWSGDPLLSLKYYKEYITYRDSVSNLEAVQQMADLRTDFEISRKQKEVDLLETKNRLKIAERNGFIWATLFLIAMLIIIIYFYRQKVKRNRILATQKMQETEITHQKALLQSVITSQEAERKRIGSDLHDEVGSALSSLRMMIEKYTGQNDLPPAFNMESKAAIDRIINNTRGIAHDLSPLTGGAKGLLDAVEELLDRVNQSGKMQAVLALDDEASVGHLSDAEALALYRTLSELVNNTIKYSGAANINIEIFKQDDMLHITYKDDGCGMEQSGDKKGMGLHNIESRLGMIGAMYTITTAPGKGYLVYIRLPENKHS